MCQRSEYPRATTELETTEAYRDDPVDALTAGRTGESITDHFENLVRAQPDRLAVTDSRKTLTYHELNMAANRIARAIGAEIGSATGSVALLLGQGASLVSCTLAVLKLGCLYVPLDRSHPQARLTHMVQDSQSLAIVTDNKGHRVAEAVAAGGIPIVNIDQLDAGLSAGNLGLAISPEALAYLIYTSGSTGLPKGAAHPHNLVLLDARTRSEMCRLTADDRVALLHPVGVTISAMLTFSTLLTGASLHLLDVQEVGFGHLLEWIQAQEISVTTARILLHQMSRAVPARMPHVRLVNLGGDTIHPGDIDLCRRIFSPELILINYATTETGTITYYFIAQGTEVPLGEPVPAGYPVEGKEMLLWDQDRRPVGKGQAGEIVVRSRFLSPGYWRRPGLTRARFLPDPFGGVERVYLTGDLGRLLPDGCLIHLGRLDSQVKVRGYRVETGEVERALVDSRLVRETAVLPHVDAAGELGLVAYVVPIAQPPPNASDLRRSLGQRLPDHMVPSTFVAMDALPRLPSGKVDRLRLPPPTEDRPVLDNGFVAPRDDWEIDLARIWERVLGVESVGVLDNFFDLGGHSLSAARLIAEVDEAYGTDLPHSILFQEPTIARMADLLRKGDRSATPPLSSMVAMTSAGPGTPLFFAPGSMSNVFTHLGHLARRLGPGQPFYGLQEDARDPTKIEAQAALYVCGVRTVQPAGPYFLGGVCHGGVLAFEMARQLQAQGQQVAFLGLVEPSPIGSAGPAAYARLAAKIVRQAPRRLERLIRRSAREPTTPEDEYLRQKMRLVANSLAAFRYKPEAYSGRVDLFVTAGSLAGPDARHLRWQALVPDSMRIHQIPGCHAGVVGSMETPIDEASMIVVASQIRACLEEIRQGGKG